MSAGDGWIHEPKLEGYRRRVRSVTLSGVVIILPAQVELRLPERCPDHTIEWGRRAQKRSRPGRFFSGHHPLWGPRGLYSNRARRQAI